MRSTCFNFILNSDLTMHVPGNILLTPCLVSKFAFGKVNAFAGCFLDSELEVHLLRFRLGFRFEDACSRQHLIILVFLSRFQEMHLQDASPTQNLWSTCPNFTLNSDLKMHVPGYILLTSFFQITSRNNAFAGSPLGPELEVHLLRFYIEV